jgi:hypothetical protein
LEDIKMSDFHTRAAVADHLRATNSAPVTTSEWVRLLNKIDEAQDIAARKTVAR